MCHKVKCDVHFYRYQDAASPFKEPFSVRSEDIGLQMGHNGSVADAIGSVSSNSSKDKKQQTATLVLYMVDPFAYSSTSKSAPSTASIASSLAYLKCFQTVMERLPEELQSKCVLQMLPLSTIASFTNWRNFAMERKLLKSYCFAVYSKCSTNLLRFVPCKSLTSFGPASDNRQKCKQYGLKTTNFTPPFVLIPPKASKNDSSPSSNKSLANQNQFSFKDSSMASNGSHQDCRILFVTYCLSHDHRWILVSCTDSVGHILQVNTINVECASAAAAATSTNQNGRKKSSASKASCERRGPGLEKLWEFVLSIISQSAMPWRIVIGRFGRLGHGEIKGKWFLVLQHRKSLLMACCVFGSRLEYNVEQTVSEQVRADVEESLFHLQTAGGLVLRVNPLRVSCLSRMRQSPATIPW